MHLILGPLRIVPSAANAQLWNAVKHVSLFILTFSYFMHAVVVAVTVKQHFIVHVNKFIRISQKGGLSINNLCCSGVLCIVM